MTNVYTEKSFSHLGVEPILTFIERFDELRGEERIIKSSDTGMWIPTGMSDIREVFQHADRFSSAWSLPTEAGSVPSILTLDPPLHTSYRQVLSPLFAPRRVAELEAEARALCIELVEELAPRRACDFVADFAGKFPTSIFLTIMGLPQSELPKFLEWEHLILHTNDPQSDPDGSIRATASLEVNDYLLEVVRARRQEPADDLVSQMVHATIDGEPIGEDAALATCSLLFIAGLDTVTAELTYAQFHLATHPADRQRIVDEPTIVPKAIEELLRAYSIVMTMRRVAQDTEFLGCPMKKDDIVLVPTMSANRDDTVFAHPRDVDFDREPNPHIAFGAGPHRCLGSHLARLEMAVAIEEWHKRIPHYHVTEHAALQEHGFILGVTELPLTW